MISAVFAVVALAVGCFVNPIYGQATAAATINCYQCSGGATTAYGSGNPGCAYPANMTSQPTVPCQGQCVVTTIFDGAATTGAHGWYDTVNRGCTRTTPPVGCASSTDMPGKVVCVSVCSTDLCNSAVALTQSTLVQLLAFVGLLTVAVNYFRK